jgi:hypothetical protein
MSDGLSITDLDFVVRFYTVANGQLREDAIRAPQQNEDKSFFFLSYIGQLEE